MVAILQGTHIHSLLTAADLHFAKIDVHSSGPPLSAPSYIGQTYFDEINSIFYIAIGTGSIADWVTQSNENIVFIIGSGIIPAGATRVIAEVDTSATAITLTMPPHQEGLIVTVVDFNRNSFANNITLVRNSGIGTIDKVAGNFTIDSNGASFSFISQQSISNWAII